MVGSTTQAVLVVILESPWPELGNVLDMIMVWIGRAYFQNAAAAAFREHCDDVSAQKMLSIGSSAVRGQYSV